MICITRYPWNALKVIFILFCAVVYDISMTTIHNWSQDEEDVKAVARLFADMGDAYVELIATGMLQCLATFSEHDCFYI